VRLFYGDQGGMNLLYMNDEQKDLDQYYDDQTFKAFSALTDKPLAGVESKLQDSLAANAEECKKLITDPNTYVFLGGQEKAAEVFNQVMEESFGSAEAWNEHKQSLIEKDRWAELLYH
jgi:ferredoxin--NADP+ reductase